MPHQKNRLLFLTSFSYPTHHAHPVWGLQMARAWTSLLSNSFVFVISDASDVSILKNVSYVCAFGRSAAFIQKLHLRTLAYALWLPFFLVRKRFFGSRAIVFTNDARLAVIAALYKPLFRYQLVFESHGEYTPRMRKFLYSNADRIVFISRQLQQLALKESVSYRAKSTVVLNGVAVDTFACSTQVPAALRKELGIDFDGTLVGYMGRFWPGNVDKGVPFMVRALAQLPDSHHMLFVGGTDEEIRAMKVLADEVGVSGRVLFRSFVPTDEVPKYACACDVLAYAPEITSFQMRETLPMKLFEYLAARRPVVVSDTPAIREIVDESCAHFCQPGSVGSFRNALARAEHAPRASVERAYERVKAHTWLSRAQHILDFCAQ